jgi:hypothetical protein
MVHPHVLLVTFPSQGQINPALQFAKRLVRLGAHVTFTTSVFAHRRMTKTLTPHDDGLSFATYSDGYDNGTEPDIDVDHYMSELKRHGSQTLTDLILSSANEGRSFTCLVCTTLIPWAADVASGLDLPSALLWIQPATVFDIYYYYFKGYGDLIENSSRDPSRSIQLPGLPLLTSRDLPSFLVASNTYAFAIPTLQEQLKALEKQGNPRILVNTFDSLEPEALTVIKEYNLIEIGPLIPYFFWGGSFSTLQGSLYRMAQL